jgi:hypothetical protein
MQLEPCSRAYMSVQLLCRCQHTDSRTVSGSIGSSRLPTCSVHVAGMPSHMYMEANKQLY